MCLKNKFITTTRTLNRLQMDVGFAQHIESIDANLLFSHSQCTWTCVRWRRTRKFKESRVRTTWKVNDQSLLCCEHDKCGGVMAMVGSTRSADVWKYHKVDTPERYLWHVGWPVGLKFISEGWVWLHVMNAYNISLTFYAIGIELIHDISTGVTKL